MLEAAADAQDRLVSSNIRLVHKVAGQYRSRGVVAYEDLVQVRHASDSFCALRQLLQFGFCGEAV